MKIEDDFIEFRNDDHVHQSPIRTVTRREIVPGVYGKVEVEKHDTHPTYLMVRVCDIRGTFRIMNAEELREAAHILNQIAEVLEDG